ncbi:sensor histidine kinase [Paenibacillus odorifer]|uniref:sensor histidine kinase n=1 Tax=Paenibacillus odorifer TaxID=189426 RepID=UPI00096CC31B|nr:histidine kinase [Paenibacillus odorifer]OME06732.1 hypothetical protein BSK60_32315 [Paenibacillus odorifer]
MGMRMVEKRLWRKLFWPDTLKGRLWILLVIVTITPIILIGFTSYYWMYKAQEEKISSNYQSMVNARKDSLEKVFANLSSVSQLLVVDGGMGDDVIEYLHNNDPVQKTEQYLAIDKSMTNIIFSSPTVNGLLFYFPDSEAPFQFESAPMQAETSKEHFMGNLFPTLYVANQLSYQGPHPSVFVGHPEAVFSLTRKIEYSLGNVFYIYLETRFAPDIKLSSKDIGASIKQLIVNPAGKVLFSQVKEISAGTLLKTGDSRLQSYKSFSAEGVNGWKELFLIPQSVYTKELNQWQIQFLLTALLSLTLTVMTVLFIWRMVYRPLSHINKEIKLFSYNQKELPQLHTRLKEFNSLFNSFQEMRQKVTGLLAEVEDKERRKAELEVEKLMSQINPHFLHNTLNTIQFLALEKGQMDIFELVKVFTRVLHYNLKKNNMIVTIREEIDALQDYIELQNIRYDHRFNIPVELDPEIEAVPIPRFVLQPLVENALYHGLQSDQGSISVTVRRTAEVILLTVADEGNGIPEERMNELLNTDKSEKSGMGIGLGYVRKMLEVYYGNGAEMTINSKIGEGTVITIRIPATLEREGF